MDIKNIREAAGAAPEAAGTGRVLLTLITAGEGSSGSYPVETLKRAAEEKAFPRGTQGHIDHDTVEEMQLRPAGSLKNLALILDEDAFFVEEEQALKAHAKVSQQWRHIVDDFGEFIGASISAGARINENRVVEQIVPSWNNRVDLVTVAGRGGKIDAVLESIRVAEARASVAETTSDDIRSFLRDAVHNTHAVSEDDWAYMMDYDKKHVYFEKGGRMFRQPYSLQGVNVTLSENPIEVRRRTEYDPVISPADPVGATEGKKEAIVMAEISDQELTQLRESADRVATLEAELKAERDARAQEAKDARVAAAQGIVKEAFGEDAPGLYLDIAESKAAADDFDADAFKAQVEEAAAATRSDNGAGNPNVGDAVAPATESKSADLDWDAALEGKN